MTQSVTTNGKLEQNFTTWSLANAYAAGDSVIYGGSIYVANAAIPANTAWATGTTGATWSLSVLGTTSSSIVQITTGGLSTVLFRTSDGKVYGASGSNIPQPGICKYYTTDLQVSPFYGIPNASPIMFYDSTLDYEEPTTSKATYVGIQGWSAYVLFDSGNLWVWGRNDYGQLGTGDTTNQTFPRRTATGVAQVFCSPSGTGKNASQYSRGLYLGTNGKLYGCGYNGQGQLGLNDTANRSSWTELAWAQGASGIRNAWNMGAYVGCIIVETNEGTTLSKYKMCGYNGTGQLGNGTTTNITNGASADVTAAWTGTATTNYRIKDAQGGFAYNDGGSSSDSGYLMLWIQDSTATTTSRVKTCGGNSWGSLGTGNLTQQNTPYNVQLPTGTSTYDVKQISAVGGGVGTAFALLTNGDLYAWGDNRYGTAGLGTTAVTSTPTKSSSSVKEIMWPGMTFYYYEYLIMAFMRKTDGSYWGAGPGAYGELGYGNDAQQSSWARVLIPKGRDWAAQGWMADAAGSDYSMHPIMYDTNGILWSWGRIDWNFAGNQAENDVHWLTPAPVNPPNL